MLPHKVLYVNIVYLLGIRTEGREQTEGSLALLGMTILVGSSGIRNDAFETLKALSMNA